MKSTVNLLLSSSCYHGLRRQGRLADFPAVQPCLLDDRTVVSVPVTTNRVTTISFPGPIDGH